MEEVIKKAAVLIEALPYIQAFRHEIVVVKLGGSAQEDKAHVDSVLADVTFMECVGMRPVLVHGGGKAITRGMEKHGVEAKFVQGHRVTCEKTIEIVEQVIKTEVNPSLVAALEKLGARAKRLDGETIVKVTKKTRVDPATGEVMDWGFVGVPGEVNPAPILAMLERDTIPVITPLGCGPDGRIHNVNADSVAAAVAKALKARKLVFLTDVPGLLRNPDDPQSIISTLKLDEVEYLVKEGVISGGMLPKVQGGVDGLHAGVRKVHMVDGRMPHSLLLEIFTDKGVGTEIVPG
jgi:acetylglutamate kinase